MYRACRLSTATKKTMLLGWHICTVTRLVAGLDFISMVGGATSSGYIRLVLLLWMCGASNAINASCPVVALPQHTVRNTEDLEAGTNVTYTCDPGTPDVYFDRDFNQILTTYCEPENTSWVPPPRPCEYLRCNVAFPVQFANKSTVATWVGTSVTYYCRGGYTIGGEFNVEWTLECQTNGAGRPDWVETSPTTPLPETCAPKVCQPPDVYPSHASAPDLPPSEMTVGSYLSYWCDPGYLFPPFSAGAQPSREAHPQCQNTKFFNYDAPSCEPVTCPTVYFPNSNISSLPFGALAFVSGNSVTWTCVAGMFFPGGSTVWSSNCTLEGDWDPLPPSTGCAPPYCQDGWHSYNVSCYYVSNPTLGQKLTGMGARNYCIRETAQIVAVVDEMENDFVLSVTYDTYNDAEPQPFWIGMYKNKNGETWQWRDYQPSDYRNWLEGYPQEDFLEQAETQICAKISAVGYWKDSLCKNTLPFVCKKGAICGPSPELFHGTTSTPVSYGELGTTVTFTCDPGYHFISDYTSTRVVTCEVTGYWSHIESCQSLHCPYVQAVANSLPSSTHNTVGTVITYSCKPRFLFNDTSLAKAILCQNDGSWNDTLGDCTEVQCPVPGIQNADPTNGNSSTYDVDVYTCRTGYEFPTTETNMSFICNVDETWWPHNTHCQRKKCPAFVHEHATVSSTEVVFEDKVIVTCEFGYAFFDTRKFETLECLAEETYDKAVPECLALRCLGVPPNVTGAEVDTEENIVGTQVNYTCTNGTVYIDGQKWRLGYCDPVTLLWSNIPTKCVDHAVYIQTLFYHAPAEAEAALDIGTIALVTVSLIIAAIIIWDLVTCPLHFARGKEKPPLPADVVTP